MWQPGSDLKDYTLLAGRSCEDCAMCCYLMGIEALQKPAGTWCSACSSRKACDRYETRPDECRDFYCHYRFDGTLSEKWRPNKSKLLLVVNAAGDRLTVRVDPKRPAAWRDEPFYNQIKQWAVAAVSRRAQVIVEIAGRHIVILPDHDRDLGRLAPGQVIVTVQEQTPYGVRFDAELRDG